MPIKAIKVTIITKATNTVFINFQNSLRDFVAKYWENTGTKAALLAPSAANSLNILGIRKATKKAWASHPVPKVPAMHISLIKPRTLDKNVALLIIEADLISDFLVILDYNGRGVLQYAPTDMIKFTMDKNSTVLFYFN